VIQLSARSLRDLAAVLDGIDGAARDSKITLVGHAPSALTLPQDRNPAMAHDVVLGLAYNDAVGAHVIEIEG